LPRRAWAHTPAVRPHREDGGHHAGRIATHGLMTREYATQPAAASATRAGAPGCPPPAHGDDRPRSNLRRS